MSTTTGSVTTVDAQGVRVALAASLLALLLSAWSVVDSLDDAEQERAVEARLTCLELPGANDCGLDGR